MSSKNVASLAFAVLGIVALLSSISILQAALTIPFIPEDFTGKTSIILVAYGFPFVLLVATGVLLIVRRARLADWAVVESDEADRGSPWNEVPDLAFAILGLYLVVSAFPALGSLSVQVIHLKGLNHQPELLQAFQAIVGQYLGKLVELVIGAYLFMYAHRIGRWWRRQGHEATVQEKPPRPQCPGCGTPFDPADYRDEVAERRCSKCRTELPGAVFS